MRPRPTASLPARGPVRVSAITEISVKVAELGVCAALGLVVLGATACGGSPPVGGEDRAVRPDVPSEAAPPDPGCDLDEAAHSDLSPDDSAPAICCINRSSVDLTALTRACGWGAYRGESQGSDCVHAFEGGELRLSPVVGLDRDAALALHARGFEGAHAITSLDGGASLSAHEDRRWAFFEGPAGTTWRASWLASACPEAAMAGVIEQLTTADDEAEQPPRAHPALGDAPGEVAAGSLLAAFAPDASAPAVAAMLPPDESTKTRRPLPSVALRRLGVLMSAVAAEDLEAFRATLAPDARVGLPDRRELGARPIVDASRDLDGRETLDALRRASARLPATQAHCPRPDRRLLPAIERGELPLWCLWTSEDGLDVLVFALRPEGFSYVGLFPERPDAPIVVDGQPPAPPLYPRPELRCPDPHALLYPGTCPELEAELRAEQAFDGEDTALADEAGEDY